MALETGTYISDLVPANPVGGDPLAFADDHMRLVKTTLKNTFPNITGAMTVTQTDLNNKVPNAVQKDGTVAMTGALSLSGNGTTALHAIPKQQLDAVVAAAKEALYPVGSIYTNAVNSTNPSTLLGFGTWVAFGAGRVPVGVDGSDTLFNTPEKTGGSKDAIVVSHSHTGTTGAAGAASGSISTGNPGDFGALRDTGSGVLTGANYNGNRPQGSAGGGSYHTLGLSIPDHTHSITTNTTGSSGTNANVQPFITVYMWKRTV